MKKRLLSLLALIMAFVLCFSLIACGGDTDAGDKKPSGSISDNKDKDDTNDKNNSDDDDDDDTQTSNPLGEAVSITLGEVLGYANDVWTADGIAGTASYTLSTKNTKAVTKSVSIDKRANKVKAGDVIIDLGTGYCYYNAQDGYKFKQYPFGGASDYAIGLLSALSAKYADQKVTAYYDKTTKTTTYKLDMAQNVNKYLTPLYSAYSSNDTIGTLIDEYCTMLLGMKYDDVYAALSEYVKNEKNTVDTFVKMLNDKLGVDLLELVVNIGKEYDEDIGKDIAQGYQKIKNRKIAELFVSLYDNAAEYLDDLMSGLLGGLTGEGSGAGFDIEGAKKILIKAFTDMFTNDNIDTSDVAKKLDDVNAMVKVVSVMNTKLTIDMALADNKEFYELYSVIKEGVTLKEMSITVSFKVDDKKVNGVKIECFAAHTYSGKAEENSPLADNDYLASVELAIDEYKTKPADFDIKFDSTYYYNHPISTYVFSLTGDNISVYYETAGTKVTVSEITLYKSMTGSDNLISLEDVPKTAVVFDAKTSSFIFDGKFVKSVLEGEAVGTELIAMVRYEGDDVGYGVTLTYLEGEPMDYFKFFFQQMSGMLGGMMGGDTGFDEYVPAN